MSTIFQVLPTEERIPSFRLLLERAEVALAALIDARTGLATSLRLNVSLLENKTNRPLPLDLDAAAKWPDSAYAWFTVVGVPGGTDAYFDRIDEDERSIWLEETQGKYYAPWADPIHAALRVGYSWRLRRSAGQTAVINLAYAVLAAQLATLCGGFIESSDSAWDSELLPAWPSPFLQTYFDPTATKSRDFAEWAQRCLDSLPLELGHGPAGAG